ncbi:MAG: sulfite exporter TauE/SafE family protein [Polyangiaceae bacterium]|nr:sulfite exporter TauE/SafE family protein [Polyangiaceae bacterium]
MDEYLDDLYTGETEVAIMALLAALGAFSGILTTVAGLGGGILLLLALSLVWGPVQALAVTAPALLISNFHRLVLFRKDLDKRVSWMFALGALPGSLVGGLLAARVPEGILTWMMIAMTLLAVTRALKLWSWNPSPGVLLPAGAAIGVLTGTSGGAGVLVAPLLIASGLKGNAYIATAALCAVAMHSGRVFGYSASGLLSRETLLHTATLSVALLVGNVIGKWARARFLNDQKAQRIEIVTLVACVLLSVSGLGH